MTSDETLIRAALEAAGLAGPRDVPIGAVVFAADGTELARAANAREALGDPTAHAEVLALRAAAQVVGDGWRLEATTLAVTVEPCTMCAGALVLARVARLVFGAWGRRPVRSARCGMWCATAGSTTARMCAAGCWPTSAPARSRRSSGRSARDFPPNVRALRNPGRFFALSARSVRPTGD